MQANGISASRGLRILVIAMVLGWGAHVASAQVASSLVNEGDILDSNGFAGYVVSFVQSPAVNDVGGWAVNVNVSSNAVTLSQVYGTADGIAAPAILLTEGTYGSLVQTSFETRIGFSNAGSVCYSASGNGGPDGLFDSVWVDATSIALEGEPTPPGILSGLFWSFASAPTMTGNGIPLFAGGTRTSVGGSTSAYGLFNDTATPLLYSGLDVFGLPAGLDDSGSPVSFDFAVSANGNEYLVEVEMETTGTGVGTSEDNAIVMSGEGLFLGGSLVQEDHPIPAAAGGLPGESWDNFDFYGVSEMGEYLITGDTLATTLDEFVVVNGVIVMREGDVDGPWTITGDMEAGEMNESGDWAVMWDVNPGTVEALIVNGSVVLTEGDDVDFDGDGAIDVGLAITAFNGLSGGLQVGNRDANGDFAVYFSADVGPGEVEGVYRMVFSTPAGASGDLELRVTDRPDPQVTVPGDIEYAVRVRNNSGAAINSVVVTTVLDPGLVFDGGASDPIAMHAAGTVTANLGTMAANEVRTYTIVANAPVAGTYTTTSSVAGGTADTVPGNNDATNITEVGKSTDLSILLADTPDPVVTPGGLLVYTVDVFNDGPSAATGVVATINLDPTTTFNAGASDPGAMHAAGVVTINVGAMPADTGQSFGVAVNVTVQGTLSADASVTGVEGDPIPDNNTDSEDTLFQLTTDLSIAISDSPDPVLPVGGQITYQVAVANDGPSDASGVTASVTLDDSTSFVSSDSGGVHDSSPTGGVVSFNIGAVASGTNGLDAIIVVDTLSAGRAVVTGVMTGGGFETDPDLSNNSTLNNTLVVDSASGLPVGVFSNIASSSTSDVPGLPGAKFGIEIDQPKRSPNGKLWIVSADTDLATTQDEVIIVGDGCSATTVVQEGVTVLTDVGDLVGLIDAELSINDAGQFAFATNSDGATTTDEVIAVWNGVSASAVIREGNVSPVTGGNYSTSLTNPNIVDDNTTWFFADTTLATDLDGVVLSKNGFILEAQEDITIPTGQDGGAMETWEIFDTGGLWVDATGANYILRGDLHGSDSGKDDVFVVNDAVVIQEGVIIPGTGFTSRANITTSEGRMVANGDWLVRSSNSNGEDWVIRNGGVLGKSGDPIVAGAVETYNDASFGAGFFLFAANKGGDYILGSVTDAGEDANNAVLTLNGDTVIVREDDPIDLDGNGILDDGIRIRTFGNDDIILTEDLQAYFTCTLRDFNDGGSNTDIGDAFVRINLCGVATVCGDLDNDKDVDADDYDIFVLAFGKSSCDADYHRCADFDDDGVITQVDYQQWLLCYRDFSGMLSVPATIMGDFDRDGDVDLADIAQYQICAGTGSDSVPCRARFDFDGDSVVTGADVIELVDIVAGP